MKSGIYQIVNKNNYHIYIGSAVNIQKRCNKHKNQLRKGIHPNKHLQNSWDLYGENKHEFSEIEFVERENLLNREQFYLDFLKPEYNKAKIAGNTLGIFPSEETRKKLSIAKIGNKNRVGIIPWNKNKTHSMETLNKLCVSQKKRFEYSRNPKAKLNEKQVNEIRELYKKGNFTYTKLSELFYLDRTSIGDIVKNKTYKLLQEKR